MFFFNSVCLFLNKEEILFAIDWKKNEQDILILRHHHHQLHRKFMIRFRGKTLHVRKLRWGSFVSRAVSASLSFSPSFLVEKCRAISRKTQTFTPRARSTSYVYHPHSVPLLQNVHVWTLISWLIPCIQPSALQCKYAAMLSDNNA